MLPVLSEEDLNVVISIWKLEDQVKKLYTRMLSRKYTWHHVSDMKYDGINVHAAFTELDYIRYVYFCTEQRLTELQHSYL